jgi:hypothetical protein
MPPRVRSLNPHEISSDVAGTACPSAHTSPQLASMSAQAQNDGSRHSHAIGEAQHFYAARLSVRACEEVSVVLYLKDKGSIQGES